MRETVERNKDEVVKIIDKINNPIRKSISPKGLNVAIQQADGSVKVTNDGDTIRRAIKGETPMEETIIRLIKDSADRTHQEVGDARSSTITMTSMLTKEALSLIESGHNHRDIAKNFTLFRDKYVEAIRKLRTPSSKDDLFHVAKISANNDEEVAKHTIEAIDVIGEHGMAFLGINKNGNETFIEKELGFNINGGIQYKELLQDKDILSVIMNDVPLLITDKRLYYLDEAEAIISVVKEAGYDSVVIVAREFIKGSDAVNSLVHNHSVGNLKVCMIADPNVTDVENETLYDLASYLDGKVITERSGDLVNNITIKDFSMVKKVYQDPQKALITPIKKGKNLAKRIKTLKEVLKKGDNEPVKRRLASLTTGNVNIFIGGSTVHEIEERTDRYTDAINATRKAMTDGFAVGGGVTLLKAFSPKLTNPEYEHTFKKYSETIIRQIAENCSQHPDTVVKTVKDGAKHFGYNALTDSYGDLLKAGVLEPLRSLEMIVENSISTAITMSSIATFIINKEDSDESK